jgi:hypothetical protein
MTFSPEELAARRTSVNKRSRTYPGMVDKGSWRRSNVHRHTRFYGCWFCGVGFRDPTAVYTHIDKRHPGHSRA